MAQASAEGHRVVVVFGTGGEFGEVADGFLTPGETLGERRAIETADQVSQMKFGDPSSGSEFVDLSRIHVQAVRHLPQGGESLQGVPFLIRS
jgi:hypothetical protein